MQTRPSSSKHGCFTLFRASVLGSGEQTRYDSVNQWNVPPVGNFSTRYSLQLYLYWNLPILGVVPTTVTRQNHDCSKRRPNCHMYIVERRKCCKAFLGYAIGYLFASSPTDWCLNIWRRRQTMDRWSIVRISRPLGKRFLKNREFLMSRIWKMLLDLQKL